MSWHKITFNDPSVCSLHFVVLYFFFFCSLIISFRLYLWSHLYCVLRPQRACALVSLYVSFPFLFFLFIHFISFYLFFVIFSTSGIRTAQFLFTWCGTLFIQILSTLLHSLKYNADDHTACCSQHKFCVPLSHCHIQMAYVHLNLPRSLLSAKWNKIKVVFFFMSSLFEQ